jgi:SAM-dependent methyltransferase
MERLLPPADDPSTVRAWHEANRASWNEAAAHYTARVEQTIDFLRAGGSSLHPIERANLGPLPPWCNVAIHLQCASGRDTLSLWVEGARRVVGLDISDVHIANARRTAEALDAPATWYRRDVLDAPSELDGTADLVYTGRGALCWVHDLGAWARVIARLLRPGGIVHVLDDHPATVLFDVEGERLVLTDYDYFTFASASRGWQASYIDDLAMPTAQQAEKYQRAWPIAEVFGALHAAGLTVEHLGEHREGYWDRFAGLSPDVQRRIPLTFSMLARRPG